ncbi:signal peptidase I [Luteimonas sp. FXH3W]|uniref:Signal peptidase I n=1 Tax=Aquilutibacter rugosus TaxID=3115820 RepID=A0ABU7V0P9_9GAMM
MIWFEKILVTVTLLSGLIWLLDKLVLRKQRGEPNELTGENPEPWYVDYAKAFFPVLLVILVVRSFIVEPFKIPSNSMMPTLLTGDFIFVNKFKYGLRLPITNKKFVTLAEPQRGDVVVFRPPHKPNEDWIKRVVGLPGDRIAYKDTVLTINGKPMAYKELGPYQAFGSGMPVNGWDEKIENLGGVEHPILEAPMPPGVDPGNGEWVVPAGHYFVMGDDRDNSEDTRFWQGQFLPESNLRGKAMRIFFNWDGGLNTDRFFKAIP